METKNLCSCEHCEYSNSARIEDQIPNFTLTFYNPETQEVEQKNVESFRGKWLVLFFYPADFTFVCPTELKDLNQKAEEIKAMGNVEVL
jgi:Peroxiredoxin